VFGKTNDKIVCCCCCCLFKS